MTGVKVSQSWGPLAPWHPNLDVVELSRTASRSSASPRAETPTCSTSSPRVSPPSSAARTPPPRPAPSWAKTSQWASQRKSPPTRCRYRCNGYLRPRGPGADPCGSPRWQRVVLSNKEVIVSSGELVVKEARPRAPRSSPSTASPAPLAMPPGRRRGLSSRPHGLRRSLSTASYR